MKWGSAPAIGHLLDPKAALEVDILRLQGYYMGLEDPNTCLIRVGGRTEQSRNLPLDVGVGMVWRNEGVWQRMLRAAASHFA